MSATMMCVFKISSVLREEFSGNQTETDAERTLKTWRTLLRSDFHPAIVSLSVLEWKN